MVVRCTKKMLELLGGRSLTLSELQPTEDDWYLNLLWIDRQKCLLLTHAGTLFSIFRGMFAARTSARSATTSSRPSRASSALRACPTNTFSQLQPDSVQLAKTREPWHARLHEPDGLPLRYLIADAGGLGRCDIDALNDGLRRTLRNRGEYVRPIELVARQLTHAPDRHHFRVAPAVAQKTAPPAHLPNPTVRVCEPYGPESTQ